MTFFTCSTKGASVTSVHSMRTAGFLVFSLLCTTNARGQSSDFVGPESCKSCHPGAYTSWMNGKHSRAKDSLPAAQQKDARCLSCHSPNESTTSIPHVTCETCHGGGHRYSADYVMRDSELARLVGLVDPTEKSCRTCHDDSTPSLKPFDFAEKLKLIDHWSAERKKKAEPTSKPPTPRKK